VRAALEQIGIKFSQTTCGRLLALNRKLYGLPHPKGGAPRVRKEMPFRASFKHEYLSGGAIRFAETNETRSGMASKEVKSP